MEQRLLQRLQRGELPLGVGFGGGDARERVVEQADEPVLFGQRGEREGQSFDFSLVN